MAFNKIIFALALTVFLFLILFFSTRMLIFRNSLEDSTDTRSCLEKNSQIVVSGEECHEKYNGREILGDFDNVPQHEVCCQMPSEK